MNAIFRSHDRFGEAFLYEHEIVTQTQFEALCLSRRTLVRVGPAYTRALFEPSSQKLFTVDSVDDEQLESLLRHQGLKSSDREWID